MEESKVEKRKRVSPVVAVIVVLVVVVLVAVVWMRASAPPRTSGGMNISGGKVNTRNITPAVTQTVEKELQKAKASGK